MTKKDYELIAKTMSQALENGRYIGVDGLHTWEAICLDLARAYGEENPRFNTVKFLDACGFDMAFGYGWRTTYANC
jgi:hypothetical protein